MPSAPCTIDLPPLLAIEAELGRRSLGEFIRQGWKVLEPGTEYVSGWHLDAIVDHLQAVSQGQIRNLLINMPPRHMKSLAVSVYWPVWEWINRPNKRFLFSSYALSLSIRDSLKCRRLIESPWFQERWGGKFALTSDQNAKIKFENDQMGYRLSTSVGAAATGEGGDFIACDDPHNVIEAESDLIRQSTIDWWRETMSTRGNDPKTVAKIVVMQRVHELDLSGYILKEEADSWCHLCLPARYEGSRSVTSIGWSDPRTKARELLWPNRFGEPELTALERSLGSYGVAGQLQQRPAPAGGGVFKLTWFRRWKPDDTGKFYMLLRSDGSWQTVPVDACERYITMDVAGTEKNDTNDPDYTVIQVWDRTPAGSIILVDQLRGQMETPDAAQAGVRMVRQFESPFICVEKNGLGLGVVQTMRRKGIAVKGLRAKGDKLARSQTAQIFAENGMIYLPESAGKPWVDDLLGELSRFPAAAHDDQVDALSYAAIHAHKTGASIGMDGDAEHEAKVAEQDKVELETERVAARRATVLAAVDDEDDIGWTRVM
jgi:predicted phage terminase large subunit-like protein